MAIPHFQYEPDKCGKFGKFGGKYVPETLMSALQELEYIYSKMKKDSSYKRELRYYLENYAGRPTPLYFAQRLTDAWKGPQVYLKREDLCHTGSHKINNCLGQILLAVKMGKKRIIAETGAGQHGVATATVAALFGLKCDVYMGSVDMERQALNVFRMKLLGASVTPVHSGSKTLKDAMNEAIRDWVTNVRDTYYIIGSVGGPHPYPQLVRDFQTVIGREARQQFKKQHGGKPDVLIACVGGGSNSIGLFFPFMKDPDIAMIGVEAGGLGISTGQHAARFTKDGKEGVLHGAYSYVLTDKDGQVKETHSIAAGLDYPSIGPQHAYFYSTKRVTYVSVTDKEVLQAFSELAAIEGIIPALESAHAVAYAKKMAKKMSTGQTMIINLSGRGDKDVIQIQKMT